MNIDLTDIRKSPIASSMDFKKLPEFQKYPGYLRIEWLYWIWDITW